MNILIRYVIDFAVAIIVSAITMTSALAVTITHDIDFFVIGDDETERRTIEHSFLSDQPMEIWFDGFAKNRSDSIVNSNGLLAELIGGAASVSDVLTLPPLPSGELIPIALYASLADSPTPIGVQVEGLGCCDDIHIFGTLTAIGQVPEPSTNVLCISGALLLARRNLRDKST